VSRAQKKTTPRRELARNPHFEQVSPEVGELDEGAFDDAMEADPDAAMAMLADLTSATDPVLRELARRLAGRVFLDISRRGPSRPRGVGRLVERPYRPDGGDLDLDASMDAIIDAGGTSARRHAVDAERLRVRGWVQPDTALCLLVDRSGSMGGKPLATSAVAAASVAWRAPSDYSVVAFGKDVVVAKSQDHSTSSEQVVNAVLSLRGFGTTDLTGALRVAAEQLARSRAGRKVVVLLSDCRSTVEGDHHAAARALEELVVIAPEGDSDEAEAFSRATGARLTTAAGPASVADALARVLS
jgi:Mg-chelatase subunit ChlD